MAYFSFQPGDATSIAEDIAGEIRAELNVIDRELPAIVQPVDSPATIVRELTYPFFLYSRDSLLYWSSNEFVPAPLSVSEEFDVKLIKTSTEAFLARKTVIDDERHIISLITLQRNYIINNDYLKPEWNDRIFSRGNFSIHEPLANVGVPVCLGENCLFRISFSGAAVQENEALRTISCILISVSLVFFAVVLYDRITRLTARIAELGVVLLYMAFLLLRWAMTSLSFPHAFIQHEVFDPQVFASSPINASLGDLFLNTACILVICNYVFRNFFRFSFLRLKGHALVRWAGLLISGLCILFAGLFPFVVIQTLYNNSSIVLDISQSLQFDSLRIIAVLTVLLSGVCAFLFSHAFIRILASETRRWHSVVAFLISIFIFSLVNLSSGQVFLPSLVMTCVYFALVYFPGLYGGLKRLTYNTFAYLFISIFCLSLIGASAIRYFSEKEKIDNQFRFANNFLIDRDIFGEYLLHEAAQKIANDAFTQTRINSPFLGKEAVGQKIRQFFLPSYFNKYAVEIYIFNAAGDPVGSNTASSFSGMVDRYEAEPYRTSYPGIYFVNNPASDVTQKYLIVVPVERLGVISGHVVVELSLKKIIPENVYPELLVDYGFQQFYRTQDLSYAVYANGSLVFTSGDFNYEKFFTRSWLGEIKLYTEGLSRFGFDHIAQEDHNGRVAVVSTPETPIVYEIANFSFLFVLGLFIILLMIFIQGIYNYMQGSRLFFTARIQLYLNLAFFIPLIIVSISIVGLTSKSSQQQLDAEYLNKSRDFGEEIIAVLNDYLSGDYGDSEPFTSRVTELANLSNVDANIYTPGGLMLSSSQPKIFESHLLSPYINPEALNKIRNGENALVASEQVGELKFFVAYAALKSSQSGELIGILGIPFFQSAYFLEKAQIVILTNILNIFAVIFILLLVLSYFVSEWLTFPLRFITQSLRKTSLTKMNHPLRWNANDEIGLMVKEYNSMLYKLSESKNELEQTQREKAWREIAQQVAHEIKNPLTPMKLTLQQLERSLQGGNGSADKSQKAIAALLSQVDTLNEIASSFSGFAKMPEPVIRRVDLVDVVRRTVDLHRPSGIIEFRTRIKEAFVMGDEQMLSRTFSNLILNGLQSGLPGQAVRIQVSVGLTGQHVRLEIRDNGRGIDPAIADRIFLPHFSTKKSGTGLGLAISKQGLEQMKGKIWFETQPGKGSSFYVELPRTS